MALYTIEGIVLKTQNIGEADRVCTIYSPGKGKQRAVARGARRPEVDLSVVPRCLRMEIFRFYREVS